MYNKAIKLDGISFHHKDKCIYKDISCSIPKNKITAILGPSGTGKTTLLHLIGGLLKPSFGKINVLGKDLDTLSNNSLMNLRKEMGVLFQSGALFTHLNIFDNVAFPLRQKLFFEANKKNILSSKNNYIPENIIKHIVMMKLESVGLRGAAKMMPNELSGGMLRRAALARAIALDPKIMMYDEPFTGQDPISLQVILKLIKTLNDALNITSVIVSHDIKEVLSIADYVLVVANQGLLASGTPDEIYGNKDAYLQQFLTGHASGPLEFNYPARPIEEQLYETDIL